MATKKHFEPFDAVVIDWESYLTRFKYFLAANDIESTEKQHATFLANVSQSTFNLAQALVLPVILKDTPFSTIKEELWQHFVPKRLVIVCCHVFYKRDQSATETIAEYITVLGLAAHPCGFENLEVSLWGQFVCGL